MFANPALFWAVWFSIGAETSKRLGHACDREQGAFILRRRGRKVRPRRSGHAGKADLAPAPWWPRLRPLDLPAGLFCLGRHSPDHLSRPPRQRPERGWSAPTMEPGAMGRRHQRLLRCSGHRKADRVGRIVRRHGGNLLCHPPSGTPFKTGAHQHRSGRRLASGSPCRFVRALRRRGSRSAGAPPVPGGRRPPRLGLDRRLATAGHAALHAHPARSRHGAPCRQPVRGAAMVHQTGRRKPQLQHARRSAPHPVSNPGARRRRRSHPPDREPGGYRSGAALSPRAIRAVCGLPACRGPGCA